MLHLKISPWIFEDSLWLSNKIRSFSDSSSAKNRIMLDHSAACKDFECANTMSHWDQHVNRKCKACGLCMSQWVFWSIHIFLSIGFHMSAPFVILTYLYLSSIKSFFFSIQMRYQQLWLVFQYKKSTKAKRCLFTFLPHGLFGSQNESFLTERIDMSQERMQLSELSLQLVNHILMRRLGAWRLPWDRFLFCPI